MNTFRIDADPVARELEKETEYYVLVCMATGSTMKMPEGEHAGHLIAFIDEASVNFAQGAVCLPDILKMPRADLERLAKDVQSSGVIVVQKPFEIIDWWNLL